MFTSVKNNFKRQSMIKLLTFIVGATQSPAGFGFVDLAKVKELQAAEPTFVSINETMKDDKGNVAVKATDAAVAALAAANAQGTTAPAPAAAPEAFEIESGIPLPVIKRGGIRTETYPFDKLQVGQSFFVPATATRPNPAKSLASTVSSATRRYKAKDGRRFTIRAEEKNGVKGARIFRVESKAQAQA